MIEKNKTLFNYHNVESCTGTDYHIFIWYRSRFKFILRFLFFSSHSNLIISYHAFRVYPIINVAFFFPSVLFLAVYCTYEIPIYQDLSFCKRLKLTTQMNRIDTFHKICLFFLFLTAIFTLKCKNNAFLELSSLSKSSAIICFLISF